MGGYCNNVGNSYSAILGGKRNITGNFCSAMIVGSNITANRACTAFVNDLSVCSFTGSTGCNVGVSTGGLLVPVPGGSTLGLVQTFSTGFQNMF
jgi:hypothetical protein